MRLTSLVAAISVVLSIPALANDSVFRWSAQSDALTLDPHALAEGPTVTVIAQIYEPLVDRDADLAFLFPLEGEALRGHHFGDDQADVGLRET